MTRAVAVQGPIKIDVDRGDPLSLGQVVRRLSRAGYRMRLLEQSRSPSGIGWHLQCWVTPRPRTAVEIVALQLLLGSDVGRESVNLLRARRVDRREVPAYWRRRWNVLYSG